MKCNICKGEASISLNHHNLKVCQNCFIKFFKNKVERTVKNLKLFDKEENLLLAVSGGKDSMGLWHLLLNLGYKVDGLYIDLGIENLSDRAKEKIIEFTKNFRSILNLVNLKEEIGFSFPELTKFTKRAPCSLCGLLKRYIINNFAIKKNYDAIITGHNLDDEASTLFKNVLGWELAYFGRQAPLLDKMDGFAKKVKPYIFCYEKETLLYATILNIPHIKEACPYSKNAKNKSIKQAFHIIEDSSPSIIQNFMKSFLKVRKYFIPLREAELKNLVNGCKICGYPTDRGKCALCTIIERGKNENSSCK